MGFNSSGRKNAISMLISLALHGGAFLLLCISFHARPPKPQAIHAMKVSVVRPEPPKPEPPKLKPEPPKPEPPKPEPRKPEPPKPEPPKPEPPKPEPPKPKPEPPKPEPPKVVKPLPEPPKPKPEPPKPQPKPEQPKPKPQPKSETPKTLSIEERIKNAEIVKKTTPKKQINTNELNAKLNNVLKQDTAKQPSTSTNKEVVSAGIVIETANYAEQVVKPYIQQNWIQPVKGELDVTNPTPVEISFTVYATGSVSNVKIVKRSNSRAMNASVEKFIGELRLLSPLSSIGSKAQSLKITVSMVLTN